MASNIVAHRDENGGFRSRAGLQKVRGLGPKAFQLSAGFLRIRDSEDPLDASGVHPETYPVVRRMVASAKTDLAGLVGNSAVLHALRPVDFVDDRFGLPTVTDILVELGRQKTVGGQEDMIEDLAINMARAAADGGARRPPP